MSDQSFSQDFQASIIGERVSVLFSPLCLEKFSRFCVGDLFFFFFVWGSKRI